LYCLTKLGGLLGQDGRAISACGANAALVAEIDDRIHFSKHFVILGNVECLGLLDAQIGTGGCNSA